MKKFLLSTACLVGGNLMVMASLNVDITFVHPSDTVLTATLSGSTSIIGSPALEKWDFNSSEHTDWRTLSRDSGVNILASGGDFEDIVVSNSSATVSNGSVSATVTHVDFFSRDSDNRNDFGFSFDQNPAFSGNDTVTFSGSFDFTLPGKTAADFSIGTWTEGSGVHWQDDLVDESLTLTVSQVPEPSAYAAILGCLGLTLALTRRKGRLSISACR